MEMISPFVLVVWVLIVAVISILTGFLAVLCLCRNKDFYEHFLIFVQFAALGCGAGIGLSWAIFYLINFPSLWYVLLVCAAGVSFVWFVLRRIHKFNNSKV